MLIAIMGAGAVGCYFGSLLVRAEQQVVFIARGAQLEALCSRGLTVSGPRGKFSLPQVHATNDPAEFGPYDLVLFCVKTYDTETAASRLVGTLHEQSAVVTLQNGIDAVDRLARILPSDSVVGGVAYMSGKNTAPGELHYTSGMSSIAVGIAPQHPRRALIEEFRKLAGGPAGFEVQIADQLESVLWSKFVLLAVNAALTSLAREPAGVVFHDPDFRELAALGLREVIAVAKGRGVPLPSDIFERSLAHAESLPPDMYASMYHDLSQGRRLELESLSGAIVRMGRELGIDTPVHLTAYCCLKKFANGTSQGRNG